ncbi:RNA pseudouridine synthase [Vibrio sp. A8-1]|uniref:RluA family pseudouridine synthase n=1 Tax=Vibrio sp. A8-1 TaxID=2591023 RepID=UPI001481FCBA|nr:RluA family pseudouridine synthase [Vibrio sp. A8-1]NNN85086.1 RNA pseudouridine synthase [Vibrio sp. A8-1]
MPADCFTPFITDITNISLPERFTYPFCYQPHPLALIAAKQLQTHLTTQNDWVHPFGIEQQSDGHGKMFGVLVVKNAQQQLGYLAAFSGQLAEQDHLPGFVPPVFDRFTQTEFFSAEANHIAEINQQIKQLMNSEPRNALIEALQTCQATKAEQQALFNQLAQQSVQEKWQLKQLKLEWQQKIAALDEELNQLNQTITTLKQERKQRSARLQYQLFSHYFFLNQYGEKINLNAIFAECANPVPPAGAGECAAPKLLHYAFQHQLTPIALAEFWWGSSPKSEIRQHGKFYPACQSKCQPILAHMLKGMPLEDNPLLVNPAEGKQIEIVYQDEAIVVINKPAEFLSVPGVNIKDSAFTRLAEQFPNCEGPFVLHRLDMSTSGLLVFALTRRANKSLQKQFITRQIDKQYVALLSGELEHDSGDIALPLASDLDDRPRQKVCFETGKSAQTRWEKVAIEQGQTRVNLYPHTGRTHQLRVHCAHPDGLGFPIVGDDLYGQAAERLCLHAQKLSFYHPYHHQKMTFEVPADF